VDQSNFGFWNRILRVNLSRGEWQAEQPGPQVYRRYIGGRTLALYFFLRETSPGLDPLGAENKLIFVTSPTTGTPISGQARHTVLCKSPLTGGLADSQSGGWWGAELKFAGWDGIIVEGASAEPVYLYINDQEVKILSAGHLWGKTTGEVQQILLETHPEKVRILQCGPAGENQVRYSAITSDLRDFNARGGVGAVMGSKKLRAIVVKGSNRKIRMADSDGLRRVAKWFAGSVKEHPAVSLHHELGTPTGDSPDVQFPGWFLRGRRGGQRRSYETGDRSGYRNLLRLFGFLQARGGRRKRRLSRQQRVRGTRIRIPGGLRARIGRG